MVSVFDIIKDICFPPICCCCGNFTNNDGLCADCWGKIRWISDPKCCVCGRPFELDIQQICGECMREKPKFNQASSVFIYDDLSKGMILKFKHYDCSYMALQFANWIYRIACQKLAQLDVIIPVPISFQKRLQRKYNQSELLCMELHRLSGVEYEPRVLEKIKSTHSQEGLSRIARKKNLIGSFGVNNKFCNAIMNKNIALIDDVFTTGSTVNECAKILKKFGANSVSVFTLARVVR